MVGAIDPTPCRSTSTSAPALRDDMKKETPRDRLMRKVGQGFLDHGYDSLTMIALAKACDLTRRALYHHFTNKEDAFRESIRWRNARNIEEGIATGMAAIEGGSDALDALTAVMDTRYGETRRQLARSPNATEINYEAFRRCRAVMIEAASNFHVALTEFLAQLEERGLLRPRADVPLSELAKLLADGARGVNQSLPPPIETQLPVHYRRMCEAILYGSVAVADHAADLMERSAQRSARKH